jgi:hypothetical protein
MRTLRAVLALGGAAVVTLVVLGMEEAVDVYARHLCRWPATISCDDGSDLWRLLPIGMAAVALVTMAVGGLWVWMGRHTRLAFALHAWFVGFPVMVFAVRPRQIAMGDLVVVGLYVSLAIELLRQVLIAVARMPRLVAAVLALVAVVALVAAMGQLPDDLADAAVRARLSPRP